ncbi:MAG: MMPL family transporter [Oligoflexia bacterium]|nr:MMPL family transporter [Oligoflexia bacterium]
MMKFILLLSHLFSIKIKDKILLVLALLFIFLHTQVFAKTVETGSYIFLPTKLENNIKSFYSFPFSWWNFILIKYEAPLRDDLIGKVTDFCKELREKEDQQIQLIQCGMNISEYLQLISSWANDYPLRQLPPSEDWIKWKVNKTLTMASLPSIDRSGINISILRNDPFMTYEDYIHLMEKRKPFSLEMKKGLLINSEAGLIVIPIMFSYPPEKTDLTKSIARYVNGAKDHLKMPITMFGPHASNWQNKTQIMSDLQVTGVVGVVLFTVFIIALVCMRGWKLLLLVPPIAFAVLLSATITSFVFGSIHGLTISFGMGLIGLGIDYGLLSMFSSDHGRTWKSNLAGLLTTLVVLFVLLFSSIPLIRQMMFFSILGLSFAFLQYYILDRFFYRKIFCFPFPFTFAKSSWRLLIFLLLLLSSPLLLYSSISYDFNIRSFDYKDSVSKALENDLFKTFKKISPVFVIDRALNLGQALEITSGYGEWSSANKIPSENLSVYLPKKEAQEKNLSEWSEKANNIRNIFLQNANLKIFFEPFLTNLRKLSVNNRPPDYVHHLISLGSDHIEFLSLWYPTNNAETALVKKRFPNAFVLKEQIEIFPEILQKELLWMIPLTLVGVVLILVVMYRRVDTVVLSMLPFFTALGFLYWFYKCFHLPVTFINVVTFLIIYGASFDYGVFACDAISRSACEDYRKRTWSSVVLAAISTIFGFAPLMLCKHPVLLQIGQTATIGMLGTLIGTLWGIPSLSYYLKKLKND